VEIKVATPHGGRAVDPTVPVTHRKQEHQGERRPERRESGMVGGKEKRGKSLVTNRLPRHQDSITFHPVSAQLLPVQMDFLSRMSEFLDVAEGLASATCKRIRQITPERTHPKIANATR